MIESQKVLIELKAGTDKLIVKGKNKIVFGDKKFKKLLQMHTQDTIWITVSTCMQNKWVTYKPFYWKVEPEAIDSFLTYRLIEPGYEVWNKVSIAQRNITNFDENLIGSNNLVDNSCMNCHIPNKYKPNQSFLHIRGPKGMTVIAQDNKLYGIKTRLKGSYSSMIYGNWHPSGKYIAFSTNSVLPATHSIHTERAFVYDTVSDVVILNIETNEVINCPFLMQKDVFETFPEFSSDGTKLFFCSANKVSLPNDYKKLQYRICSVAFNPATGTLSNKVDTLFNAPAINKTATELKASPNGKYLAFGCFSYGTFALWHTDAKIYLYNLNNGSIDTLPLLNNSCYANAYHSWSTNSRWLAFASKRDNGLYSKVYFSYIDNNGHAQKPFVLPQKNPEFYDSFLKSYNVPELVAHKVPFDAFDIEKLYQSGKAQTVHYKD